MSAEEDATRKMKWESQMEGWKQDREERRSMGAMITAESNAMFESVIGYGQMSCRASLLINGGSSVAILAFLGQVFTRAEISGLKPLTQGLANSLCLFVIGTVLAAVTTAMGYFTQKAYAADLARQHRIIMANLGKEFTLPPHTRGNVLTWITVPIGIGSLVCFVWGAWVAKLAFVAEIARMAG